MTGRYTVTPAVVEQRRNAATVHGAKSPQQVRNAARGKKRALLRKLGKRASELDALSLLYVDLTARALGKLTLLDAHYIETGGIVREDGEGAPTLAVYVSLLNTATRTARMLSEHLARQGEAGEDLAGYLEATYARGNGDSAHE